MTYKYRVWHYPSDGNSGSTTENYDLGTFQTLNHARHAIRFCLGLSALRAERRWYSGEEQEIECWHDKTRSQTSSDGCGGFAIIEVQS